MTYQRPDMNRGFRWQDPANLVLAVWFFFSPWILQFGNGVSTARPASGAVAINAVSNAAWDAWVLGVLVFLVALSALGRFARGQEWANLIMGAWIFVAPWALGFSFGPFPAAAWDHWIVGALIILVSAWSLTLMRREPEERIARSPEGHIEEAPRR